MTDHKILRQVAEERERIHSSQRSHRPLSEGYEYLSLVGEDVFGTIYGFPINLECHPVGDGHIDFYTPIGTVDVKTARKAYNLLLEEGLPCADILVLAAYSDEKDTAWLVGWEYGSSILRMPTKDFGYGVINHYKESYLLRKMAEFKSLLEATGHHLP